jgi:1-acyl-sn-glycerol-3-phosphate acyltransferase
MEARLENLPARLGELGIDPFGFDPEFTKAAIAPLVWLYQNYFRVEVQGLENIPEGRVLLVSNHSGQIPIDGAMIGLAAFLEGDPPRAIRAMFEKWVPTLPFISIFMSRVGQVVGTPANCRRLLDQGECILVFPEGARGITKPFHRRYQLADFGLGFMRLALETETPIVPVGVVGAEEQIISVANLERVAKLAGLPALPVIPQLLVPVLGWAPLPTKYRIYFGEAMRFEGNPDDEDAEVGKKVRVVRNRIEGLLEQGLKTRRSVFY